MGTQLITLNVKSDVARMVKSMNRATREKVPQALSQSMNTTIVKARTVADEGIRKELNLKKKQVFKRLTIFKSNRKKLIATLIASGRPIPVVDFGAKQTKRGVSFKIKNDRGRRLVKGAFIATMRSGHKGVFQRTFKKDINPKKHGLPIDELFTTSIPQAFTNNEIKKALKKLADTFLIPEFGRNLKRLLVQKK